MNGKSKGNSFEREICGLLSNWWIKGRDDIFWRTASSGGRATQRTKKGSTTKNQYGDITATDPVGQPLLDVFTMELKRGYPLCSFADLLDVSNNSSDPQYRKWISGINNSANKAGSLSWMLIVKRNRRQTVIFTSKHIIQSLENVAGKILQSIPQLTIEIKIGKEIHNIVGMTLDGFFSTVKPSLIRLLADLQRKQS